MKSDRAKLVQIQRNSIDTHTHNAYLVAVGQNGGRVLVLWFRCRLDRLARHQLGRPDLFHLLQHLLVDALVQEGIPNAGDDVIDHGVVQFQL